MPPYGPRRNDVRLYGQREEILEGSLPAPRR
jgi:hypothetical protein